MIKVPMICVNPVYDNDENIIGTEYMDSVIGVEEGEEAVDDWLDVIQYTINEKKSIILYRQDVRVFADKVGGKQVFRDIKAGLRDRYTVLKLKYNPRTQEFCGEKTAFIIHKR